MRAVAAFGEDLARGGYSSYTLRDYRTDVMRLGLYLDIAPESVGEEHLAQMEMMEHPAQTEMMGHLE